LRSSIAQTTRAQNADVFLGRTVRHRENQVPSTSVAAEDAVPPADPVPPPARPESEEFFVEDPIDHLLHLADESQPNGNIDPAVVDPAVVARVTNEADREPGSTSRAPSPDSTEPSDQTLDDDVLKKRGRRSNGASAALDAVCAKAMEMFESTAQEHGLAPEQVFAHFHKAEHRVKNTENAWNLYQKYFRQFLEEEMSRLPEDMRSTIRASGGRVSSTCFVFLPLPFSQFV